MKQFSIFHTINSKFEENAFMQRQHVFDTVAKDLDNALVKSQNHFNIHYAMNGNRSTTVGDLILDCKERKLFMIGNQGYSEVDMNLLNFIDMGTEINLICSRKLLDYPNKM